MDKAAELRQRFLLHPAEESFVDYKEGIALKAKDNFTIKLIKHIIGMCNAGGGFIVIGYGEDNEHKQPSPSKMTHEISASYDVSTLALMVEKYTAGTDKISIKVHKEIHPLNNITYPIIEVHGFEKRPFFCKIKVPDILEEGALYIRIPSARTIKIADPDAWDHLIDQCITKRNENLLSRFGALVQEMGILGPSNLQNEKLDFETKEWVKENRSEVIQISKKSSIPTDGLQFSHWPINHNSWNQNELKEASDKAIRRNTGWPMGLLHDVKPVKDGIKNIMNFAPNSFDYWALSTDGKYYYFRNFDEDLPESASTGKDMWFDVKIWRIAEAIDHTIELYKALGLDPSDKIYFSISHFGIKNRLLKRSNGVPLARRESEVDLSEWSREFSLDYLQANKLKIIKEICTSLFQNFDFFQPSNGVFIQIMDDYNQSKI